MKATERDICPLCGRRPVYYRRIWVADRAWHQKCVDAVVREWLRNKAAARAVEEASGR